MDLAALFNGSYQEALELVEKRAEDVRAGHVKTASGLNDWVNKNIGAAARSGASDRIGNWWRDASADPAKLGLIGAGTGLGLGAAGSMLAPRGRRRPMQGALLGGLMGGAAMGGYGLMHQIAADKAKPLNNYNAARNATAAAEEARRTAELAQSPLTIPRAVGRDTTEAIKRVAKGDIDGAMDAGGRAALNLPVIGEASEIFDTSGKNDSFAPSTLLQGGVNKATGTLERNNLLNPGEGQRVGDYINSHIGTANPTAETMGIMGAADLAMKRRAGSLYNPQFLREGLTTAAGKDMLTSAVKTENVADATQKLRDLSRSETRTALGGGLGNRLVRQVGTPSFTDVPVPRLGSVPVPTGWSPDSMNLNSGYTYQPPTPAASAAPGATPAVPPAAPPKVHLSQDDLQSISQAGKTKMMATKPERGILRSGFGSAEGGRLGGIGVPRGVAYAIPATAVHWGTTQAQNHNEAVANLGKAQQNQAVAEQAVNTGAQLGLNKKLPVTPASASAPAPGPAPVLTPKQHTQAANKLISEGNFAEAQKHLSQVPTGAR